MTAGELSWFVAGLLIAGTLAAHIHGRIVTPLRSEIERLRARQKPESSYLRAMTRHYLDRG